MDHPTDKLISPEESTTQPEATELRDETFQKNVEIGTSKPIPVPPDIDFAASFSSGIVKLTLDAPGWPFHVHITPLQAHSAFFAEKLHPAGTRTIQTLPLPDFKLEPFKLFIQYVYTHNYTIPAGRDFHACWLHAQVYFLGGRIRATGLRTLACQKLKYTLGGKEDVPVGAVIRLVRGIYEHENSDARREASSPMRSDTPEKSNNKPRDLVEYSDEPEDEDEEMADSCNIVSPSIINNSNGCAPKGPEDTECLKQWVIRYIAHKLERFRVNAEFRSLVEEHKGFAFDLLCAVSSGPPLVA